MVIHRSGTARGAYPKTPRRRWRRSERGSTPRVIRRPRRGRLRAGASRRAPASPRRSVSSGAGGHDDRLPEAPAIVARGEGHPDGNGQGRDGHRRDHATGDAGPRPAAPRARGEPGGKRQREGDRHGRPQPLGEQARERPRERPARIDLDGLACPQAAARDLAADHAEGARGVVGQPGIARKVTRLLEPVRGAPQVPGHLGADANAHRVGQTPVVARHRVDDAVVCEGLERANRVAGATLVQRLRGRREERPGVVGRRRRAGWGRFGERRATGDYEDGQRDHRDEEKAHGDAALVARGESAASSSLLHTPDGALGADPAIAGRDDVRCVRREPRGLALAQQVGDAGGRFVSDAGALVAAWRPLRPPRRARSRQRERPWPPRGRAQSPRRPRARLCPSQATCASATRSLRSVAGDARRPLPSAAHATSGCAPHEGDAERERPRPDPRDPEDRRVVGEPPALARALERVALRRQARQDGLGRLGGGGGARCGRHVHGPERARAPPRSASARGPRTATRGCRDRRCPASSRARRSRSERFPP